MNMLKMERKISAKGSLTVPSGMRRDLGIEGKVKVMLIPQDNGDILVKRIEGTCMFCGSYEDVVTYKGRFLCENCLKELGGMVDGK